MNASVGSYRDARLLSGGTKAVETESLRSGLVSTSLDRPIGTASGVRIDPSQSRHYFIPGGFIPGNIRGRLRISFSTKTLQSSSVIIDSFETATDRNGRSL